MRRGAREILRPHLGFLAGIGLMQWLAYRASHSPGVFVDHPGDPLDDLALVLFVLPPLIPLAAIATLASWSRLWSDYIRAIRDLAVVHIMVLITCLGAQWWLLSAVARGEHYPGYLIFPLIFVPVIPAFTVASLCGIARALTR